MAREGGVFARMAILQLAEKTELAHQSRATLDASASKNNTPPKKSEEANTDLSKPPTTNSPTLPQTQTPRWTPTAPGEPSSNSFGQLFGGLLFMLAVVELFANFPKHGAMENLLEELVFWTRRVDEAEGGISRMEPSRSKGS